MSIAHLGKSAPHIRWNECSSKGKSMNKLDIGIVKKECTLYIAHTRDDCSSVGMSLAPKE